ncbi:colanic acid biosynthesis acetyltransferase WcaF [Benzoatithermus flavus]|uniref:Colanic acid biosynthesis acetyltransferase WcaF n=1 Tax=Benzoatithermus flavus TaxID=3108223 RepID=A0ABU8XYB4_9PROT
MSASSPLEAEPPRIFLAEGIKRRRIQGQNLARYEKPVLPGNRGILWRAAWYVVNALLFRGALLSLLPSAAKAAILRLFGARVGRGLVCKPRVGIKHPWFLELGDHVWLGEGAWIDNHCRVRIGSHVCISQEAYLCTGNHDWNDPGFAFRMAPIEIGEGAWIGARAILAPGAVIRRGEVVAAGRLVTAAAAA